MKDSYTRKSSVKPFSFVKCTLFSLLLSTVIFSALILITALILFKLQDPVKFIPALSYCILYSASVAVGFIFTKMCRSFPLPAIVGGAYILFITVVLFFLSASDATVTFESALLRLLIPVSSVMGGVLCVMKSKEKRKRRFSGRTRKS